MILLEITAPNLYVVKAHEVDDSFKAPERFDAPDELIMYFENPEDDHVDMYLAYVSTGFYDIFNNPDEDNVDPACESKLISSTPESGTFAKMWLIDDYNLDQFIEKWSTQLQIKIITDPSLMGST